MTKSLLFFCCCAIIVCLALMAQDKSVLALSNDGDVPRLARYFEGGLQLVREKRACPDRARCSEHRQCEACCFCFEGHCCQFDFAKFANPNPLAPKPSV
ncbi:hypothetical protein GPALN_010833 [Globodera pallida]|nr:hypothetical protein GPALN_010833 [Globodera pallida]